MAPTSDFLKKMPSSIVYMPVCKNPAQFHQSDDWVQIGDYSVNIEKVTKQELISMRRYLPQEEYRLLKNRKSARLCRIKRKQERTTLQTSFVDYAQKNEELKKALDSEVQQRKELQLHYQSLRQELNHVKTMVQQA